MKDISVEANGETLRVLEAGPEDAPVLFFFHSLGTSSELCSAVRDSTMPTSPNSIGLDADTANQLGPEFELCLDLSGQHVC